MYSCIEKVFKGEDYIAVYGAGYVGASLAAVYLRKGLKVILVDVDVDKLRSIEEKTYSFPEKEVNEAIYRGLEQGFLKLYTDGVKASRDSCIKVVTVPVYMDWVLKKYSFDALTRAIEDIGRGLKKGDLVLLESSVPPGTTEEIVKPILERTSGLKAGRDFYLAYSPERVYIGRAVKDIEENYPKIVSGVGEESLRMVSEFYRRIVKKGVIELSSTTTAEFEKLAEGIYRDVNIALANELALVSMILNIDYYEVRKAANSQPYCHLHLPGPGVGGYCIPLYPYFVMNRVVREGFVMDLTRTARSINETMPYVIVRFVEKLCRKNRLKPSVLKVVVLGDAFRGDIDDTRLSPTHDIVALLKARGFKDIVVHDPYVREDQVLNELNVTLTNDLAEALRDSDIVLIVTRHSQYHGLRISDLVRLSGREPYVIDTIAYVVDDMGYDKLIVLGKSTDLYRSLIG